MSEVRDIQAKDVQIRDMSNQKFVMFNKKTSEIMSKFVISNQKTSEIMWEVRDVQAEYVRDDVKSSW